MDGYWEWIKPGLKDSPNIFFKANEKVKASTKVSRGSTKQKTIWTKFKTTFQPKIVKTIREKDSIL